MVSGILFFTMPISSSSSIVCRRVIVLGQSSSANIFIRRFLQVFEIADMRLHQHAVIISGFQFIKPVAQVVNDLILNAPAYRPAAVRSDFSGTLQVLRRVALAGFYLIEQRSLLPGKVLHQ
jgi:hypothetical protein